MDDRFGRLLAEARDAELKDAAVRVFDTAALCKAWFDDRGLTPTPADLLAATRMVLEQAARGTIQAALDDGND